MSVPQYCTDLPGEFYNNSCVREEGGFIACGYIAASLYDTWASSDFTTNSSWQTGITNGDIKVILDVKGSKAPSEPTEADGYGEADVIVTGASHEASYMHLNINQQDGGEAVNREFYNLLNKATNKYHFFYVTSNYDLKVSSQTVTAWADMNTPESKKELQEWQVSVKWQGIDLMRVFETAPVAAYQA